MDTSKERKQNTMMIIPEYTKPILTLANELSQRNIPHTINVIWDGLQIRFPWNSGDLVCHMGSYGHEYGQVESMGCPWDGEDVSVHDPEEVVVLIEKWYDEYCKSGN